MTQTIAQAGKLIIDRLDTLYGTKWKFNLFCINKAICQLVNEQQLTPELAVSHYDALTREVEAEAVALLCCEVLGIEGSAFCRGYIQNWLRPAVNGNGEAIPEKSAQKIFRAADQILRAGRLQPDAEQEH